MMLPEGRKWDDRRCGRNVTFEVNQPWETLSAECMNGARPSVWTSPWLGFVKAERVVCRQAPCPSTPLHIQDKTQNSNRSVFKNIQNQHMRNAVDMTCIMTKPPVTQNHRNLPDLGVETEAGQWEQMDVIRAVR